MRLAERSRRLFYLIHRGRLERELDQEMEAHREMMREPARFGDILRLQLIAVFAVAAILLALSVTAHGRNSKNEGPSVNWTNLQQSGPLQWTQPNILKMNYELKARW
jgi:hypothetical protein